MKTLKQISYENNINLETLRKRAFKLRLKPTQKIEKSKEFLFDENQIHSILNYSEKKHFYEVQVIYVTQTTEIYHSLINFDKSLDNLNVNDVIAEYRN